jgi:YVTN family beta-propeller protein
VAITPEGVFAYVANYDAGTVSVIDTATNTVVATIPVVASPAYMAITPDGAFAYVANTTSDTVSVIDTGTNTVVATVPVGRGPIGVAITPNGAFAYVTNAFGSLGSVSVIATATNTVVATIGVGATPYGVAITPDGAFAYVVNKSSNTVSVIDTATRTVVRTIGVGSVPEAVAIALVVVDTTPPAITVAASPATLSPPNGKLVDVRVSGMITDESGVQAITYQVIDEYGQIQPSGSVTPEADGSYAFTVQLQASRRGNDQDGRRYTIIVSATDYAGNHGRASATVTVPRN